MSRRGSSCQRHQRQEHDRAPAAPESVSRQASVAALRESRTPATYARRPQIADDAESQAPRELEPSAAPGCAPYDDHASPDEGDRRSRRPRSWRRGLARRGAEETRRTRQPGQARARRASPRSMDCPTVNMSGNAMKAAKPENASSCCRGVRRQRLRISGRSGSARQPARRRTRDTHQERVRSAAVAILENGGVPPRHRP